MPDPVPSSADDVLEALLGTSPVMVWGADASGNNTFFSRWEEFSGQNERAAAGEGWAAHLHPEDRAAVTAKWAESIRLTKPFNSEHRLRSSSGEYHWVRASATPLIGPDGCVREWVGTVQDVQREVAALEALRISEERYRLIARATRDVIWDRNIKNGKSFWGGAIDTVLGYKPSEEMQREEWWTSRIHPDDAADILDRADAFLQSAENSTTYTYRFRRADGSYAHVEHRAYVLRDMHGRPMRVVGALQDVTEVRRASIALRESEERYRFLADNASDMIVRADLDGRRRYVSPASLELTGYRPEELIGGKPADVVHPESEPMVSVIFARLARGEMDFERCTVPTLRKDGRTVWLELNYRLVRDDAGVPQEVVHVARDVTERRMLELQLRQSQKMEAIGSLSGGIAHDFNNLLTIIRGNAELLEEDLSDVAHVDLTRIILEAASRGADLTQRLLSFARRQSLQPERLDLKETVISMSALLRRALGANIDLRLELDCDGHSALSDRALLESAILNLAVNARDAMPRGGTLTVRTGYRAARPGEGDIPVGQGVVYLQVQDTGAGMTPEVLDRACEPFFTTKEVGKSSGLGLSMVYGFARQSAGHLHLASQAGRGTCATLLLRDAGSPARHPLEQPRAAPPSGQHAILVVEDEPALRSYVSHQLRTLGHTVWEAGDAEGALRFTAAPLHLLLADVVLPGGMSGIELANAFRTTCPHLPVVLMSGYCEETFLQVGRPARDMLLLRKPFGRRDLAHSINAALGLEDSKVEDAAA